MTPITFSHLRRQFSAAVFLLAAALPTLLVAAPLRIMPLGDSITAGYTDNPKWSCPFDFGYRNRLCSLLREGGYDFVFVGDSPEPFNNKWGDPTHGGTVTPSPDLRQIGQNGHRGYGGASIPNVALHIDAYLAADNPDLILLMIGINGIGPESAVKIDGLVGQIFKAKPDVALLVAQITPRSSYNADLQKYNTYIRDTLVPRYQAQGRKIGTVDQYANFLIRSDDPTSIDRAKFSNGINHPNQAGYHLMADTWMAGIREFLPKK